MPKSMAASIQELLDKQAIRDVLATYARGIDRRDWDLVRDAFHPDAIDNHGAYHGDIEGMIEWIRQRHASVDQSMHFLGNCLIEFANEDLALVETYYSAFVRFSLDADLARTMWAGASETSGSMDVSVLGRYVDRFERRDGAWRIAHRTNLYDAMPSQPVADPSRDPVHHWSRRDGDDLLFAVQTQMFGKRGD